MGFFSGFSGCEKCERMATNKSNGYQKEKRTKIKTTTRNLNNAAKLQNYELQKHR